MSSEEGRAASGRTAPSGRTRDAVGKGSIFAVLLALMAGTACLEMPTASEPLEREDLVGSYTATRFMIAENGVQLDVLARNGELMLELDANGEATGRLFVPDGYSGGDIDETLSGTWSFDETDEAVTARVDSEILVEEAVLEILNEDRPVELSLEDDFREYHITVRLAQQ